MTDKQDQETFLNVKIEIEQKPRKVEVYQKEYFYGKKPLSLIGFYCILFVGLLLVGIYVYVSS